MSRLDVEAVVRAFLAELDPSRPRTPEIVAELAAHVEDGARRHMVLGRSPEDALVAALKDVGNLEESARTISGGDVAAALAKAMANWSEEGLLESLVRRLRGRERR